MKVVSHIEEVKQATTNQILEALEACGLTAEGYAKAKCPVDTGRLRNSITHVVEEEKKQIVVGTNVNYASFVELGMSNPDAKHDKSEFETPNPRESKSHGHNPQPFLKPAITEHINVYEALIKKQLSEGE